MSKCKPCEERRKAYNILHAAKDYVTGDLEIAPDHIVQERLSICLNCPGNHFSPQFQACKICKCFVQAKTRLKPSSCPKDFWGPTDE